MQSKPMVNKINLLNLKREEPEKTARMLAFAGCCAGTLWPAWCAWYGAATMAVSSRRTLCGCVEALL
jgi:hypothetical protein